MKKFSEAIRSGRDVHPQLMGDDRRLPEHQGFFGRGGHLELLRSDLIGAALVGLLGTVVALKVTKTEWGLTAEANRRQIDLMLRGLFPISRETTRHPVTGELATVRVILNELRDEWNEAEAVKWLAGYEAGVYIQNADDTEFIETTETDGSRNRFYAGSRVVLRDLRNHHRAPIFTVQRLHHGGELAITPEGGGEERRVHAAMLVNYETSERMCRAVRDEATRHGNYLPLMVGNRRYYDIESAMTASIGTGETIDNAFGWLATGLAAESKRLPALSSREIICSDFFEVSGDYFPSASGTLPNRDDFGADDEAFQAAMVAAYAAAYPGSETARCSFSIAATEGYGYRDEDGNWRVFETPSDAVDDLCESSTKTNLRRALAIGADPNLLVQDAEIAPTKIGDRWFWTVERFRGDIFHDGLEVTIALNTSSDHRYDLIFD